MKTITATALILMATVAAFGQGTVNFSNLSTALSSPPDRLIRFGDSGGVVGIPPAGSPASTNVYPGLVAQLFYGSSTATASSLVAVSTAPGTLRSSTSASAGTWFNNGTRTLTGFNPGDTVNLQVRVWDIRFGTDYNQVARSLATDAAFAIAYNSPLPNWIGCSAVFQYTITTNPTPAPSDFNMNNFAGFTLEFDPGVGQCPEPTPLALVGLGLAGWLVFRRQKRENQKRQKTAALHDPSVGP